MKICTLLLATALSLPCAESFVNTVKAQETTQRSIIYVTASIKSSAESLLDSINYNNVEDFKNGQVDKINETLKGLLKDDFSKGTMPIIATHLVQARRTLDVTELDKAKDNQSIVSDVLDKLLIEVDVADAQAEINSALAKQTKINEKTESLSKNMLGKETSELTPQEKKDLDELAKQQDDMNKIVDALAKALNEESKNGSQDKKDAQSDLSKSDVKSDIKDASAKLSDNKLSDAMNKQDDIMNKLSDLSDKMKNQATKQSKNEKANNPSQTSKESKESTGIAKDSKLEQEQLEKVRASKWDAALLPSDRETLASVKAESFPKKYEVALVQYYSALSSL